LRTIIVELLAILVVLIVLALQARKLGEKLEQICRIIFVKKHHGHHGFDHLGPWGPFAIWCYTKGEWVLLTPCGQPGCDCGPPPPKPGSYEEQVIRKECPKR